MSAFKKAVAGALAVGLFAPALAFADTASNIQALLDQIKSLQAQIATLQQQRQETVATLISELRQGSSGDQVKVLQAILAGDSSSYPERSIAGCFGAKTAAAVKRFQKAHGIRQAGFVGPATLKKINEALQEHPLMLTTSTTTGGQGGTSGTVVCAKVPPGHLIAPGWLKKMGGVAPIVPTCQTLPPGIVKIIGGGGTGTTTPDTAAPTLSAITAVNITGSGATIQWTTNENATSQVEYGTTTAYGSMSLLDSSLFMVHSVALTGLASSTLYHFRVWSKDAANNTATSSDMSFTTTAPTDTAAPLITGVTVSPIATTTATVTWTTNEAATSKVYYGTVWPVDFGTALTMSDATLLTSHSLGITGLLASTTYSYVVESKDAANNTATTSTQTFITTD